MKQKIVNFFKWIYNWVITNLKDKHTLIIFLVLFIIFTLPITLFYPIGFITKNGWFIGVASAYLAFWLGPATPFIPLLLGLTIAIRKLYKKIFKK